MDIVRTSRGMTRYSARRVGFAAVGLATALLLTACGSGSPPVSAAVPSAGGAGGSPTPLANATAAGSTPTAPYPTPTTTPAASTPSTSPQPSTASSACGLLSTKEITAALGRNPGVGKPFDSRGSTQCQYGTYQRTFLLVNLNPTRGVAAYDLMRNSPKVQHRVDVSGVGDRAFETTGPGTAGIYVNQGDALLLVMVEIGGASSPPRQAAITLARTAAAQL